MKKQLKVPHVIGQIIPDELNALVGNLMRQMNISDPKEAVRRVNSGEWRVSEPHSIWREEAGIIYLSVTSDGTTGPEWIKRFNKKGLRVSESAKSILSGSLGFKTFVPTSGVITDLAILKGSLFEEKERTFKSIYGLAMDHGFVAPSQESACLLRFCLSDHDIEAMGLWWIMTMHNPVQGPTEYPSYFLSANRGGAGNLLWTVPNETKTNWDRGNGFAFALYKPPQENEKTR